MKASAVCGDWVLFYIALSKESSLTFAQRTKRSEEKSYSSIWGDILGKGSCRCKGPEVGACLTC